VDGSTTGVTVFGNDITERKRAEEHLMLYQNQLKSLTSQLTLTEEDLKKTIAMKLHDGICQQLVLLRVNAGMLARDVDDNEIHTSLNKMYDTVGDILDETKALTTDLSYPELHLRGFDKAVKSWSKNVIELKYQISVRMHCDEQPRPMSEDVKVVLFRGVRELLMNVVKHANASNVDIEIKCTGDSIIVSIKDNGKGFDTAIVTENRGNSFGILSISETLNRLGGRLQYDSKPGHGCIAQMVAPLDLVSQEATRSGETK